MTTEFHLAFVCPRFSEEGTVGGAETLLKAQALHAAEAGCRVAFLTTCAESHFTWENTLAPGQSEFQGVTVHRFPVDEDRDVGRFLKVQTAISNGAPVSESEERAWLANSVNSRALLEHLRTDGARYDRILLGPYLFGLTWFAARVHPGKSFLVPCLHDEPFAYLGVMRELFGVAAGCLFNTDAEMELAQRLFDIPEEKRRVVGMGLDPFEADPGAFAARRNLSAPYVLYSGRREPLKGTPLLLDYLAAFRARTNIDIKPVFTGSGPIEPPPELAAHVLDCGFVSEQEKHEAMAGALAFIHPSINESLGIVLLESWMAGAPALVHARSEVLRRQCLASGAGLWFRHYPDFEEALLRLYHNPDLRKAMGTAGRKFVLREYAWEHVMQRFFTALRLNQ